MCSKERWEKIPNERFGNERKSKAVVQGRLLAYLLCWNTYWPLPSCISVSPLSFPLFVTYTLIYSSLQLSVSIAKLFLSYSQRSVRVSLILTVVAPCCPLLPHLLEPPLFHFWKSMLHFCFSFCFPDHSKQKQPDLSLGDGFLLRTWACSYHWRISQADWSLMCKRKGGMWWQHWDPEGQYRPLKWRKMWGVWPRISQQLQCNVAATVTGCFIHLFCSSAHKMPWRMETQFLGMTHGVRQTSLLYFSRLLLLIVVIFLKDLKTIWRGGKITSKINSVSN